MPAIYYIRSEIRPSTLRVERWVQVDKKSGHLLLETALISVSYRLDAFGSPDEVVDQRSDQGHQQDDEYPGNFIIALGRFFCQTVNEHPDPEDHSKCRETIPAHE